MRNRQVGYVLIALIAIGVAGLVVRVVSTGSDELVLSGILPISQDIIERVLIRSVDKEVELVKIGDKWRAGKFPIFNAKLIQFWTAVSDIDGAQLVATNPVNHERLRVTEETGTDVQFFVGPSRQERFFVGTWSPDVQLCYVRRSGTDKVYGIPCLQRDVFDSDINGWRDPIIMSIPPEEIESISFTYPDEQFVLKLSDSQWVIDVDGEEKSADLMQVDSVLRSIGVVIANGFVDDEAARQLRFSSPDASVRVVTRQGASNPTTRINFLDPDPEGTSYYIKTPATPSVYVMDKAVAAGLLKRANDLAP